MQEEKENPNLHYWGNASEEDHYKSHGVKGSTSFYTSPRGLSLFTRSWLPLSNPPPHRGIIFMIHGYGNDISWTFQSTPIFLAQMGFACFALDLEGHGRSEGLRAFVPNVDAVVQDCLSFFNSIKQDPQYHGLPCFLFGESMGGAICLLIHFADPKGFDGAILVAPMYLVAKSVKVEEKVIIAEKNPMRYRGKPRLGTVLELLRVTDQLSQQLSKVSIPFIVLHGSADVVTDPNVSKALYEEAKSEDKTIKIYDGMMHSLLFGETDENIEIVCKDILSWLEERCKG
ncbi:caffeoylshikimate esterase [Tripterygium wilfordii]|uniref:Caffeoylshikimate esterase n=1 Tax=Tripterygium wilfordii TaxID=458696 RepID=A0A7J7C3H5_TRIWF|nr:caffeoylshikimate esterase [Tripterygium wilfordii]